MKKFKHSLIFSRLALSPKQTQSWSAFKTPPAMLFEIPIEQVSIVCPLRVESHLYYRVERVFYSLDSFFLILPRFLLRPLVLRKVGAGIGRLMDMNAGRIRYDYLERLQSSMTQFEKDLSAAVTMVAESLRSALEKPNDRAAAVLDVVDSVIKTCSELL